MTKEFITIIIERNRFRKIFIDDIIYCKADRCYSIIKTIDKEFSYSKPLKELEQLLSKDRFIRISRSFIVNITQCIELKTGKGSKVILLNNEELNLSTDSLSKLENYFKITIS